VTGLYRSHSTSWMYMSEDQRSTSFGEHETLTMDSHHDLKLELVSNPAYLCGARELVHQISKRCGFGDAEASQVALAVDEALINIMRHGYDRRTDGRIWLHLDPIVEGDNRTGIRIVIEDEARQVEPESIKGRQLEDVRPGGLGVHIIKEIMDEARYEKRDRVGMRLTMLKRASGDATPASPCGNGGCRG